MKVDNIGKDIFEHSAFQENLDRMERTGKVVN